MQYIPRYTITEKIRSNLQAIERLKDIIQDNHVLPAVEASIHLRASVESIHSSTSIEGNPLSTNEVRALITSDRILSKKEYAEIEVQNYKKALDFIEVRKNQDSNLTLNDILRLHGIITHRLLDRTRNGKIRQNPVFIENQAHQILYTAIDPSRIEPALQDLIAWVKSSQFSIHPVIIAAIIHFRLAAIHPFADGNGRTARAATSLFLGLNRYDCNGSLVLDSYYASDRRAYYAILESLNGKTYATSAKADLTPWLEYFTDGFLTSLHVLDAEIRLLNLSLPYGSQSLQLNREDQDLLSYITQFGSITISTAEQLLPEASRRSVQRRLKQLVDRGYLQMTGETRNAKYTLK